MLKAFAAVNSRLSAALMGLATAGLIVITAIVGWQVFGRYVLNSSPSWTEQAALTLMIWYVAFASAAGVREGFHIRIAIVETAAPPAARRWIRAAAMAVVGGAGVALALWGGVLVVETWRHVIPTLGLPRGLAYLCLPISGALIALFALEKLIAALVGAEGEA